MSVSALEAAIRPHVHAGRIPGAVLGVLREGETSVRALGSTRPDGHEPMAPDAVFRISSNTKPLAAALALRIVEEGALALDDPVERLIPELADRRVLRRIDGPLGETVPAARPVTVDDLLTMRLGFGFVFEADSPTVRAAAEAGLGIGPPDPSVPLTPDEWIARFAALPLLEQPGSVWRYDLAYGVLGVLLARAGGRPLDTLLREVLLHPLGMTDTAFVAPTDRLVPSFVALDPQLATFDDAEASRWTAAPAFPDARGGLVSTAADLLRFAGALLDGGAGVLSDRSVELMTTDRLTPQQRRGPSAQTFLGGGGWGYGTHVLTAASGFPARHARYGWGGGLGTLWYSWPAQRTAAVLMTQVLPPSEALVDSFVRGVEQSFVD